MNARMLYFQLSRVKVMVELGTAISVSVRFDCLFCMLSAPYAFLQGLNLGLHVARPVNL